MCVCVFVCKCEYVEERKGKRGEKRQRRRGDVRRRGRKEEEREDRREMKGQKSEGRRRDQK